MRHTSLCCSSSSAWTRETVHSARPVHPLQTLTHLQQLVFVYVCVSLLLLWARVCVKVKSNCPASLRKEVVKTACLEPKKVFLKSDAGAPTILYFSPSSPWLPQSSTGKCCEQAEPRLLCQLHKRAGLSSVLQRTLLNHTRTCTHSCTMMTMYAHKHTRIRR